MKYRKTVVPFEKPKEGDSEYQYREFEAENDLVALDIFLLESPECVLVTLERMKDDGTFLTVYEVAVGLL